MAKVHVTAKRDFLKTLTTAVPLNALAELVWNGFDAGGNQVQVFLEFNAMGGIQTIRVRDYGDGIDCFKVETLFGNLGDSWKKTSNRQNGRALHGKNGKGRFQAFALGERVAWNTTYQQNGKIYSYKITGSAQTLDDFETTDPVEIADVSTGTEVVVDNLLRDFRSLREDSARLELAKIFAAYLTEYPMLRLEYNGVAVDPKSVQSHRGDYNLGDVDLGDGSKAVVAVSIIEWSIQTGRAFHLCDANGVVVA